MYTSRPLRTMSNWLERADRPSFRGVRDRARTRGPGHDSSFSITPGMLRARRVYYTNYRDGSASDSIEFEERQKPRRISVARPSIIPLSGLLIADITTPRERGDRDWLCTSPAIQYYRRWKSRALYRHRSLSIPGAGISFTGFTALTHVIAGVYARRKRKPRSMVNYSIHIWATGLHWTGLVSAAAAKRPTHSVLDAERSRAIRIDGDLVTGGKGLCTDTRRASSSFYSSSTDRCSWERVFVKDTFLDKFLTPMSSW